MTLLNSNLFQILRGFASLVPVKAANFDDYINDCTFATLQEFFLDHILLNPHFERYPPSKQYQESFWKWAIAHLERLLGSEDADIDQRVFDHYLALMSPSGPTVGTSSPESRDLLCARGLPLPLPPEPSYITYYWLRKPIPASQEQDVVETSDYEIVTLLESRTIIESGTTGMRTWQASLALARYLTSHPDLVTSKNVLELGSGTGFLGTIVSSLQQSQSEQHLGSLWMTDVDEVVLARCKHNLSLDCNRSSMHPNVGYQLLDWCAASSPDTAPALRSTLDEAKPDIVLGADLVFDPSLIEHLLNVIKIALSLRSCEVLIALTVRNMQTMDKFLNSARDQKIVIEEVASLKETNTLKDAEEVKLFRLSHKT